MPDFTIAIGLLTKPMERVVDAAAGAVKQKLVTLMAKSKVEALHSKLWQIQRVKTIWNPDRPLALSTIYFPVYVYHEVDGTSVERQVDSLRDLQYTHCLLQGTAGQGKSILLKYLVGKEIRSGERVPVLFELRNYHGGQIEDSLSARFCDLLGVKFDAGIFPVFCRSSAVSVLLDGLDEVDPEYLPEVLTSIEGFSQKYPDVRVVLTSRPETGGESLTLFSSIKITPLRREQLFEFFKKVTKDEPFSKKLVSALRGSPVGVQGIVNTPLSATLLAIIYRAAGRIPAEFADFFEELFQVLVARHDASKLGWRRHRSSGLSDRQLQRAFEAFCFQVRRRRAVSCSVAEASEFAREGLGVAEINSSSDAFLQDIKKVTCLVVQEGRKIEFVHASVAHYFSSKFVASLSDSAAQKFYQHLLEKNWQQWLSELDFLRGIDAVRFVEHFLLPDVQRTLGGAGVDSGSAIIEGILSRATLTRKGESGSPGPEYFVDHAYFSATYSARDLSQRIFRKLYAEDAEGALMWASCGVVKGMKPNDSVAWKAVAESRGGRVYERIREEVAQWSVGLARRRVELEELVARSKASDSLLTL